MGDQRYLCIHPRFSIESGHWRSISSNRRLEPAGELRHQPTGTLCSDEGLAASRREGHHHHLRQQPDGYILWPAPSEHLCELGRQDTLGEWSLLQLLSVRGFVVCFVQPDKPQSSTRQRLLIWAPVALAICTSTDLVSRLLTVTMLVALLSSNVHAYVSST